MEDFKISYNYKCLIARLGESVELGGDKAVDARPYYIYEGTEESGGRLDRLGCVAITWSYRAMGLLGRDRELS